MKQTRWVGILSAGALLATGIAAWAAGSESDRVLRAAVPSLLAGSDLTGVSAPPARSSGADEGSDASKASGPPRKSVSLLA